MTLFTTGRPLLSVKATARFPAQVTADSGIAVTKTSGSYNFGLDFPSLTQNTSLPTPSEWWTLVYNDTTETYEQVRVDALVDYTIDTRRGIGNANATIQTTDRYVELTASLSTPRTWTLPAANAVTGGVHIIIQDAAGGISPTNTLTIQRAGSDTINGGTSLVLNAPYDGAVFYSDGTSKWTFLYRITGISVTSGKTLNVSNTLTLSGTDSSSVAFGTGGTVAYTSNKLSAFAATTSSELAGVISDETGSGALVFANAPTLVGPVLGTPASGALTNCTSIPAGQLTGTVATARLPAGTVLQVVTATTSTTASNNTTSYADTNLTASITPTSASSKILVLVNQVVEFYSSTYYAGGGIKLLRGATTIVTPLANATGPFEMYAQATGATAIDNYSRASIIYLDSPATTSSTTYKTQARPLDATNTFVCQPTSTTNPTSTITLMEIAA